MQAVDQTIDGGRGLLLGDIGQVRITCSCGGTGVAEQGLNMTQAQALFEQMGSETVSKGVDRYFFLIPHCSTTRFMAA